MLPVEKQPRRKNQMFAKNSVYLFYLFILFICLLLAADWTRRNLNDNKFNNEYRRY